MAKEIITDENVLCITNLSFKDYYYLPIIKIYKVSNINIGL